MDIKDVGSMGPVYPPRGSGETRKRDSLRPQSGSDSVELSDRGQLASQAENIFSRTPEVREERIAELKSLIEQGRFQVDARKIAKALLRGELVDRIV